MAHNVLSYGSPEAARRANRAINKIAQDGGFVGVKPTERRVHTAVASNSNGVVSDSTYDGMFKIIVENNKLQVVYQHMSSQNWSDGVGILYINGNRFKINFGEPVDITHTTYVYLNVVERKIDLLKEGEVPVPFSVLIGKYDYVTQKTEQLLKTTTGYVFNGYSGPFTIFIEKGSVCIHNFLGTTNSGTKAAGMIGVNNSYIEVPTYTGTLPKNTTYYYFAAFNFSPYNNGVVDPDLPQDRVNELYKNKLDKEAELQVLNESLSDATSSLSKVSSQINAVNGKIDSAYSNYIYKSSNNANEYNNQINAITTLIGRLDASDPEFQSKLDALNKQITDLEKKRDSVEAELVKELNNTITPLKEELTSLKASYKSAEQKVTSLQKDRYSLVDSINKIDIELYGGISLQNVSCSIIESTSAQISNDTTVYFFLGSVSQLNTNEYVISQAQLSSYNVYRIGVCN